MFLVVLIAYGWRGRYPCVRSEEGEGMPLVRKCFYATEIPKDQRLFAFLGAYDLELIAGKIRLKIGRFSTGLLKTVKFLPNIDAEVVLEVGCFCEASINAKLLVGGNHRNDDLFNHNFSNGWMFSRLMDDENRALCDVAPTTPIIIGDNVVLSDGVTVTPGACIGAGSVIGAGAVVSGTLDPLGVYAGVPARLIRQRFDPDRAALYEQASFSNVAAHCLAELPAAMMRLQNSAISLDDFRAAMDFIPERPVVEMTIAPKAESDRGIQLGNIVGYRVGERRIADESSIATLNGYFAQIASESQKVKWTADIFDNLNLYSQD